ncbi:hypothetical protein GF336_02330 [Candidatus Woesearchaeota archaeon]|nr:hypothetical protein [Candidatus Woesearchaeota archaeon]
MVQISELLGNKEMIKIFEFFLDNPSEKVSQTEIKKALKISKTTLIRWIRQLVKSNILNIKKIGTSNIYSLNMQNNIVKQVKILDTLLKLRPLKDIDAEIYLYGSAARGEDLEDSDIDLIFIGKLSRGDVIETIDKLSKKLGRKISFKIFNHIEWSQLARKDPSFYQRVEKDKIAIR